MWTQKRIEEDLRELRIREGDALIVHASMRAVGSVEGGAATVLDALLGIVGPTGTVMAPAFNRNHLAWDESDERTTDGAYDEQALCAEQVGALAVALSQHPEAVRSRHPGLSFSAIGANAAFLTEAAPFHFPLGTTSPLARLHQLNGGVLLMGVDHTVNAVLHTAEIWAEAPYAQRNARCRVGPDSWSDMQGAIGCRDGFGKLEPLLRQARILRTGYVGNAPSQYMRAQHVVSMAREILRGDMEALLCDRPSCRACAYARKLTARQQPMP